MLRRARSFSWIFADGSPWSPERAAGSGTQRLCAWPKREPISRLDMDTKNTKEKRKEMDKQNIVVTFNTSPEEKALFRELLGSDASLTFLDEIPPMKREQVLEGATILLSWNFPREIGQEDYPPLQQARFIPLLSAGADHMPFAYLPVPMLVASNAGTSPTTMAEPVM